MIRTLGALAEQTRSHYGVTLTAGGGWTSSPPGWGRAREHVQGGGR
jgi:hypothetical protein